jgi:hypothetical protein
MIRNSESDRCGIFFYARSGTPPSEWCRLHWHLIRRNQCHPCPRAVGLFRGLKQLSYVSLVHALESIISGDGMYTYIHTYIECTCQLCPFISGAVLKLNVQSHWHLNLHTIKPSLTCRGNTHAYQATKKCFQTKVIAESCT